MKAQFVPQEYVAQTWPKIEHYIASALEYCHGDYTIDQVRMFVNMGQWLLIVATDDAGEIHGAATASFINYPNDRVGFITTVGGKMVASKEIFQDLCNILRSRGATKIQGACRPSIVRLWRRFGFEPVTTIVEVRI